MQEIKIEKVTLNIGVGGTGDKLEKASRLLTTITKAKPVKTRTMKRIPTWGVRPKLEIATKVTLRGEVAEGVLKRLLVAVNNTLAESKFDKFKSNPCEYFMSFPTIIRYKKGDLPAEVLTYVSFRIHRLADIIIRQFKSGRGISSAEYVPIRKRLDEKRS